MKIEVLLTETEIADEFHEALLARDVPEKFFYWPPLSARAWLELAASEPMKGQRQLWNRIAGKAESLVAHVDSAISVVSLGAGDGAREQQLLVALEALRSVVNYYPVDASQPLLESACARAEDLEVETLGIKADISSPAHLVLASDAADSAKLFLLAGNTLGGFDPLDMIRNVAHCLHPHDRLIVDGVLHRDGITEAYDTPAGHRFAFAPLMRIGFQDSDGKMRFELKHDQRHPGLYMITRSFKAERDMVGTLAAGDITVERGERIAMNFSYAYTPEAFRWLLEEHAGLKVLEEYRSQFDEAIIAVCARA